MTNDVILKYLKDENYDKLMKELNDALQFDTFNPAYHYYLFLAKNKGYLNVDYNNPIDPDLLDKALDLDLTDVIDREHYFFSMLPLKERIIFAYANYMDEDAINKVISSSAIKNSKLFYNSKEIRTLYDYAMDIKLEKQMFLTGKVILSFIENRVYETPEELKFKSSLEEIVEHFENHLFTKITNEKSRWAKDDDVAPLVSEVKIDEVTIAPNIESVKVEEPKDDTIVIESKEEIKVEEPKVIFKEEPKEDSKEKSLNMDDYYRAKRESFVSNYDYLNEDKKKVVLPKNQKKEEFMPKNRTFFGLFFPFVFVGFWVFIVIFIINSNKNGNPVVATVFLIAYSIIGVFSLFFARKKILKGLAAIYMSIEVVILVLGITFSQLNQIGYTYPIDNGHYSEQSRNPKTVPTIICKTKASRLYPGGDNHLLYLDLYLDSSYEGTSINQVKGTFAIVDSQGNIFESTAYISTQNITTVSFYIDTIYIQKAYFTMNGIIYSDYMVVSGLSIKGEIEIYYNCE